MGREAEKEDFVKGGKDSGFAAKFQSMSGSADFHVPYRLLEPEILLFF